MMWKLADHWFSVFTVGIALSAMAGCGIGMVQRSIVIGDRTVTAGHACATMMTPITALPTSIMERRAIIVRGFAGVAFTVGAVSTSDGPTAQSGRSSVAESGKSAASKDSALFT